MSKTKVEKSTPKKGDEVVVFSEVSKRKGSIIEDGEGFKWSEVFVADLGEGHEYRYITEKRPSSYFKTTGYSTIGGGISPLHPAMDECVTYNAWKTIEKLNEPTNGGYISVPDELDSEEKRVKDEAKKERSIEREKFDNEEVSITSDFEAGILIVNGIIENIKSLAYDYNVKVDINKFKTSFTVRTVKVKINGTRKEYVKFFDKYRSLLIKYETI